MNKKLFTIALLLVVPVFVSALTKPSPDADLESYSYIFYVFYDKGQLFADRDYEIKFDIINQKFAQSSPGSGDYKLEIINFKSEVIQTVTFDPKGGNPVLTSGKVQVKAPYVADGQRAVFYDTQNRQLVTIFIQGGSLCNDDGLCDAGAGENDKTCINDCKKTTPRATTTPPVIPDEGFDTITIIIYAVGGLGVAILAWFGWKWWKKRGEDNFMPPPSPSSPLPPPPLG